MMESFRITINSHIRNGWLIILGLLICSKFQWILSFFYPNESNEDSIWIGVLAFVFFTVPAIIIHINYYLVNRGDVLEYSAQQNIINITHRRVSTTFSLDDIDHIERSISFNLAHNQLWVVSWDGYNHSVIYLKNGNIFTVTSLLVPNLDLPIEKDKLIVKRNVYRLAKIR